MEKPHYGFNDDNIKTLLKPIKKYLFKKSPKGDLILEEGINIIDKDGNIIMDSTGPTFNGGANQLNESHDFIANLNSSNKGSFDGTSDCTLGVTGVLQPENGGTGATSIEEFKILLGEAPVTSVNGQTGTVILTADDVGALSKDTNIPSIAGLASETYVNNKIASLVNSAPGALDTLNELANALGNDANFATTITTELGNKALKADLNNYVKKSGDVMTGGLTVSDFTVKRKNNYNVLKVFLDDKTTGFIQQDINSNRFKFIEKSTDTEHGEGYQLPLPATGLTEGKTYDILTSKSPVTISQGGTGATNAEDARTKLGVVAKAGDTMNGQLIGKNIGGGWTEMAQKSAFRGGFSAESGADVAIYTLSLKTPNGDWGIGTYGKNDNLYFVYNSGDIVKRNYITPEGALNGMIIETGQTEEISFANNHTADSKDVTVRFKKTYTKAPIVYISPYYNNHTNSADVHKMWYEVIHTNTEYFTVRVLYPTSSTSGLNLYLNWVAISE